MRFAFGLLLGLLIGFVAGVICLGEYVVDWREVSIGCIDKLDECERGCPSVF